MLFVSVDTYKTEGENLKNSECGNHCLLSSFSHKDIFWKQVYQRVNIVFMVTVGVWDAPLQWL